MTVPLRARLLLADDHTLVREGLKALLNGQPDLQVVAEAGDGVEAVARALDDNVDLAILDVEMPRMTGLQSAEQLATRAPHVKTLMLSMHDDEEYYFQALRAGAAGYVLKSASHRDLIEACRGALRGDTFIYPGSARTLLSELVDGVSRGDLERPDPLTRRELEILKLIAAGDSAAEIGASLGISKQTVNRHRANVLAKLGLRNRVDLTRYAIRRGLVQP